MGRGIVGGLIQNNEAVGVTAAVVKKEKKETRSQRINFLIKPSLYEKVKAKCADMDISVSEALNQLLEKWCDE